MYGLPLTGRSVTDRVPFGEAPAVVYPASVVDPVVVRGDMESASPMRQSLPAAPDELEKLSFSIGV